MEQAHVHIGVVRLQAHDAHDDTFDPLHDVMFCRDAIIKRGILNTGLHFEVLIQHYSLLKCFTLQSKSKWLFGFLRSHAGELDGGIALSAEINLIAKRWRENRYDYQKSTKQDGRLVCFRTGSVRLM